MPEAADTGPAWIKWTGLVLGPVLAVLVYALLPAEQRTGAAVTGLTHAARATAAVGALMATWWLSEAIPLEATALVPLALFPLLGVAGMKQAAAPYADEVIFLFMGGMMLGIALERWSLHKRVALWTMLIVGTRPSMLVGGLMLATAMISMWVSNTATAVMMLPIAAGVSDLVWRSQGAQGPGSAQEADMQRFSTCLMLGVAYAATIGGVGTLIGTPPNAVLKGYIERVYGDSISFERWLWLGMPIVVIFLPLSWLALTRLIFPVRIGAVPGARDMLRKELAALGPAGRGERLVMAIFAAAAASWILRPQIAGWLGLYTVRDGKRTDLLTDSGIAIIAAIAMFVTPVSLKRREFVLDWKHAGRMPWGVLLLFGGGLSLAAAFDSSGVGDSIGSLFHGLAGVHPLMIVLVMTTVVVFVTEVGSNTAVTTTFLTLVAGVSQKLQIHPYLLAFPIALAASYAFMMPTGTPPNALVFASGYVRVPQMWRAGIVLNLMSIVVITAMVYWLGPWLLGFDPSVMPRAGR